MKYRIKQDGDKFYPQKKRLVFWHYFESGNGWGTYYEFYFSMKEARKRIEAYKSFIKKERERVRKIHAI